MTVQELINKLNSIEDKSISVIICGCYASEGITEGIIEEVKERKTSLEHECLLLSDICSG